MGEGETQLMQRTLRTHHEHTTMAVSIVTVGKFENRGIEISLSSSSSESQDSTIQIMWGLCTSIETRKSSNFGKRLLALQKLSIRRLHLPLSRRVVGACCAVLQLVTHPKVTCSLTSIVNYQLASYSSSYNYYTNYYRNYNYRHSRAYEVIFEEVKEGCHVHLCPQLRLTTLVYCRSGYFRW